MIFFKTSDEVLDYEIIYSDLLLSAEQISASDWSVSSPSSPVIVIDSSDFTDKISKVWLSGGVDNVEYLLTNRIQTSDGRTYERGFSLRIVPSR